MEINRRRKAFESRVVVAADGRNSTIARLRNLLPRIAKERIALQTHIPLPDKFGDRVVLQFRPEGYSGQAPVGEDQLNLCLVSTAQGIAGIRRWAEDFLTSQPDIHGELSRPWSARRSWQDRVRFFLWAMPRESSSHSLEKEFRMRCNRENWRRARARKSFAALTRPRLPNCTRPRMQNFTVVASGSIDLRGLPSCIRRSRQRSSKLHGSSPTFSEPSRRRSSVCHPEVRRRGRTSHKLVVLSPYVGRPTFECEVLRVAQDDRVCAG